MLKEKNPLTSSKSILKNILKEKKRGLINNHPCPDVFLSSTILSEIDNIISEIIKMRLDLAPPKDSEYEDPQTSEILKIKPILTGLQAELESLQEQSDMKLSDFMRMPNLGLLRSQINQGRKRQRGEELRAKITENFMASLTKFEEPEHLEMNFSPRVPHLAALLPEWKPTEVISPSERMTLRDYFAKETQKIWKESNYQAPVLDMFKIRLLLQEHLEQRDIHNIKKSGNFEESRISLPNFQTPIPKTSKPPTDSSIKMKNSIAHSTFPLPRVPLNPILEITQDSHQITEPSDEVFLYNPSLLSVLDEYQYHHANKKRKSEELKTDHVLKSNTYIVFFIMIETKTIENTGINHSTIEEMYHIYKAGGNPNQILSPTIHYNYIFHQPIFNQNCSYANIPQNPFLTPIPHHMTPQGQTRNNTNTQANEEPKNNTLNRQKELDHQEINTQGSFGSETNTMKTPAPRREIPSRSNNIINYKLKSKKQIPASGKGTPLTCVGYSPKKV